MTTDEDCSCCGIWLVLSEGKMTRWSRFGQNLCGKCWRWGSSILDVTEAARR